MSEEDIVAIVSTTLDLALSDSITAAQIQALIELLEAAIANLGGNSDTTNNSESPFPPPPDNSTEPSPPPPPSPPSRRRRSLQQDDDPCASADNSLTVDVDFNQLAGSDAEPWNEFIALVNSGEIFADLADFTTVCSISELVFTSVGQAPPPTSPDDDDGGSSSDNTLLIVLPVVGGVVLIGVVVGLLFWRRRKSGFEGGRRGNVEMLDNHEPEGAGSVVMAANDTPA